MDGEDLDSSVNFDVIRVKNSKKEELTQPVATEVPCTIVVNGNEVVKIGFFGGSITATEGWRPKTISWLKEKYKIDSILEYNAAIGGTNPKFGVFRIDRHLLTHHDFDLVFVEFAVNDGDGVSPDIEKSMEGIVRKIWKNNPYTDICFVYTISSKFITGILPDNSLALVPLEY